MRPAWKSAVSHCGIDELFCHTGVALTMLRFGPSLAKTGLMAGMLTGPFSKVVDRHVTDPWLRKNIDLECFVLRCCFLALMYSVRDHLLETANNCQGKKKLGSNWY